MKSVRLFFLIFIPLSVLLEFFAIRSGLSGASVTLLMWSPGFAAMATLKLRRIPLSELGWQWGPARAHALAMGLPVIYGGTACLLAHLLGLSDFATPQARAAFVENGPFASLGPAWAALPMTVLTLFAAHNVFIQVILNPLSTRGEGAITIVGEFGILLALVTAAVSIPFWVRGMRESPFRTKDTSGHILHSEPQ